MQRLSTLIPLIALAPLVLSVALPAGCAPAAETTPAPARAPAPAPGWDQARFEAIMTETAQAFPALSQVTADQVDEWMRTDEPLVLLDVREADEFAVSHLRGAQRVDPEATADELAALLGPDHSVRIVAYCSVGVRSAHLAERLRVAGWPNVHNLNGSIFAWANEGRTVVRDERAVEEVHPYDADWGELLDPARRAAPADR